MTLPILSKHHETTFLVDAEFEVHEAANTRDILKYYHSKVFLPESVLGAMPSSIKPEKIQSIADDNRTIIVPDANAELPPITYYLSVKGVGTRSPMFGFTDIGGTSQKGAWPGSLLIDHWREKAYHSPVMTGEMFFGNGPYGASGEEGPKDSIDITEMAQEPGRPQCINGFWICPVLAYNQIPDWVVKACRETYWYRKYPRGWFQEMRLVPSDIRLYFHSDAPLGVKPQTVLRVFGVETVGQYDAFIEKFISSGIGALTLAARTVKKDPKGFMLLDYDDVWLDKDSVIAPDGTLHFADLDDIEWREYATEEMVRKKIARQFERNFYEFMFGLDSLLTERNRLASVNQTIAQRRNDLASRYEMALMGDSYARTETSRTGIDMVLRPVEASVGEVKIRLVDFAGGD